MKAGEKGCYRAGKGRTVPPLHDGNGGTDLNLLRKPSCGARLCLRRRGRLANRRPLRHPRLAASATGGASAAMPDALRAPRLHPQSLRKKRDKQTLVSLFWQGQKDLVSAPLRSARNLRATGTHSPLGTRFWSGCGKAHWGNGGGAVLPGSRHKPKRGWCWFGAAGRICPPVTPHCQTCPA